MKMREERKIEKETDIKTSSVVYVCVKGSMCLQSKESDGSVKLRLLQCPLDCAAHTTQRRHTLTILVSTPLKSFYGHSNWLEQTSESRLPA